MQTDTIHPNGRTFHTPYNANLNKKASKKLNTRISDYNKTISDPTKNWSGYKCPGSMNK